MFIVNSSYSVGVFAVVNCVQSHPFDCAIATSGIDNTIKVASIRAMIVKSVLFFFSASIAFGVPAFIPIVSILEPFLSASSNL